MTKLDNFIQQYNIDRKAASKLLKVSVRTVDRYVKKKKLTAQNVGGRVWLNKDEVESMSGYAEGPTMDIGVDMSTPVTSIDSPQDIHEEIDDTLSTSQTRKIVKGASSSGFYKELYGATKEELNEKQERLEIANYRVGQLEAQLKNSIPLLEYHRESAAKKLEKAKILEKIGYAEKSIRSLAKKLKFEQYNKKVILTILLVLLALQPLWLLLLAK
jgi:excisionase family DNA binding protein